MKTFSGRRALVIGGTGGIGGAAALGLAERGADLTVTGGNSQERLNETLIALAKVGGNVSPSPHNGFLCKIGGTDGLLPEQAVTYILGKVPEPDIVVCAWGPFYRAALDKTGPEQWRFLTENNLLFPGMMISFVISGMIKRGWGRILLFGGTGTAEVRGYTTTAAYSTAKTALGALAKSAALTAAGRNVTCNVVCPGFTNTGYCSAEERRYNDSHSPGGKALVPEDSARLALEILENPALNGEVIDTAAPFYQDGYIIDKSRKRYYDKVQIKGK
jgi:NAD(P)-dependent dehydrogenase (short-subunit alcohol dehydrogenase family)